MSFGRKALGHARRHSVGYVALFVALGGVGYAAIPDSGGTIHGCYASGQPIAPGVYPLALRDPSVASSCPAGYTELDWNATGPPGPPGPAGATGATGPAGKDGPPGPAASLGAAAGALGVGEPTAFSPTGGIRRVVSTSVDCTEKTATAYLRRYWFCIPAARVYCPASTPVATSGGWSVRYPPGPGGRDVTGDILGGSADALVLYNERVPSTSRVPHQGWAASIELTDAVTDIFGGTSPLYSPAFTFRVWVLCGLPREAKVLGVRLASR